MRNNNEDLCQRDSEDKCTKMTFMYYLEKQRSRRKSKYLITCEKRFERHQGAIEEINKKLIKVYNEGMEIIRSE